MSNRIPTMDDIETLLNKHIKDGQVRAQLREMARNLTDSPLYKETREAKEELDAARKRERVHHYRAAGVPETAHELLDTLYDGREVTVESVRDLAHTNGFIVEGVEGAASSSSSKESKPGDPDYMWSSPAERHAWEQESNDE